MSRLCDFLRILYEFLGYLNFQFFQFSELNNFQVQDAQKKPTRCIDEQNAPRGLEMLLEIDAATCLRRVKKTISTWNDTMGHLGRSFGPQKSTTGFSATYSTRNKAEQENTALFISQKRAILPKIEEEISCT
uniref:Uncharacterized protein n=1 Tax=Photinus pyralis TaxID=7054 RepID=A0A1Y1LVD4_PHOPY